MPPALWASCCAALLILALWHGPDSPTFVH